VEVEGRCAAGSSCFGDGVWLAAHTCSGESLIECTIFAAVVEGISDMSVFGAGKVVKEPAVGQQIAVADIAVVQ
jgi:hypothetical protein